MSDSTRPDPQFGVPHRDGGGGVLWSAATAREIVAVIAEDAQAGLLSLSEAMDLIDRVRGRAGSVPSRPPAAQHRSSVSTGGASDRTRQCGGHAR